MKKIHCFIQFIIFSCFLMALASEETPSATIAWKDCLKQPQEWYAGKEAIRIADQVLLYQKNNGGWPKNIDMVKPLTGNETNVLREDKGRKEGSTIDNSATYTQIRYLAKVFNATKEERFAEGLKKGIDFLLKIQYPNGGWPQFPFKVGYYRHITFNDDATAGVLKLLWDIVKEPEFLFVDNTTRMNCYEAMMKGVDCVLKCQVAVAGKKTAWCAQHDETTLAPAPARTYEKVSLSGSESVELVRFLMKIENPDPQIIEAIEAAVSWFDQVKITGIRQDKKADSSLPGGYDKIIVADPSAPLLWARFYEIGSNKPIFCGRDGIIKYTLAEIEPERRNGYSWYTDRPAGLLNKEYPEWKKQWNPQQ